jgi:outer membrane receptor protein involved in Fe transport
MNRIVKHRLMGGAALALVFAAAAQAQEVASNVETVTVVGTHIQGAQTTEALPVTVVSQQQIEAIGATAGDDLLRSIPSMGPVQFNAANGQQTSNSARGDIASIDLRGAGIGDTLVLVNGRRMAAYPVSQSKGNVPLITYNAQVLPTSGIERVEILRDGAGAIYGSDAVAGVLNLVTRTDFDGITASTQYGYAEGTNRKEWKVDLFAGHNFANGRGNVSVSLSLYDRAAQLPSDEPYTATQDLRSFFAGDPNFSGSAAPDGRGNQSSYPALVARSASGGTLTAAIKQGATSITTAAGSFHIQPSSLSSCVSQLANGLCIGTGTVPYTTTANSIRYNATLDNLITVSPAINRQNVNMNAHYDINNDLTLYAEVDYYRAISHGLTTQPTALVPIGVPASNYYNPLGPVTFANGQANPNRLPNLTNVPASGLPVTFATYRFNDFGADHVDIYSYQDRFILGAKGRMWGFDWDSALLYGEAQAIDNSDGVDSTALAQSLALSTPDAYNPFNGGCLPNAAGVVTAGGDCTPSSITALNNARLRLTRRDFTSLANADFKVSRPDLVALPGGNLGIAMGLEFRDETHSDLRDPRTNGQITFTDPVLNTFSASNATGVNVTPSTHGARTVFSAYGELAVPVISPDMQIPLVQKVDLQLAGRFENYSDFGSVAKPKAAVAWDVIDDLRLRASWEQGFKAPNLETTSQFTFARAQSVTDWYRCQAAVNKGTLANFNACTYSFGVTYNESGNPGLQPETSETFSYGLVFQPTFLPEELGHFTVTADRWTLHQVGVVGVIGPANIAVQDYASRAQGGAGIAALVRTAPTADDVAFYAGSGLAPVGTPTVVNDTFQNLQPQTISGVDLSVAWTKDAGDIGNFSATVDGTYLDKYLQPPPPAVQQLFDLRQQGVINPATPLTSGASQIEQLGNPRWRALGTMTWTLDPFQIGTSVQYISQTMDTNFLSPSGAEYVVPSLTTLNLYGEYKLYDLGMTHELRFRVGARNLLDKDPPLESDGYNGALFQPYGRFVYFNVTASL